MATLETSRSNIVRSMAPWLPYAVRKQIQEYAPTFLTEFLVMACQIFLYKLAAHYLGKTGFSEYALARRTVSLLQPAVMLGLGVGLPRFIALAQAREIGARVTGYFGTTLRFVGLATLLVVTAMLLAKNFFAYLLYGNAEYQYLVPPVALMLTGVVLHSVIYAYLRGNLFMTRANVLNLVNLGLAPLAIFWFHPKVSSLLWSLGGVWTAIALVALGWTPLRAIVNSSRAEQRELLRYGLQRVPGDFILLALLTVPAIFVAHVVGIEQAGYVAFAISTANMIAAMFAPIGIILLPKASRSAGNALLEELRTEIWLVALVSTSVPIIIIAALEIYAPALIRIYLGSSFESSTTIVRIVAIAAIPLALYYVLRNVIDAFHHRAVNTINLLACLIVFLAMSSLTLWARGNVPIVLWSFVSSATLLATLTFREVRAILRPKH